MLPYHPNVLLISGTGSNVGKTTLSCMLLEKFRHIGIVAVKITPHWHPQPDNIHIIHQENHLMIIRETNRNTRKDSSRMLRSGADRVYFVQNIIDDGLLKAFPIILNDMDKTAPMIIESAAMGKYIKPACHFHITRPLSATHKLQNTNIPIDHLISFNGSTFDFDLERISWNDEKWIISLKPEKQ